MKTYIIVLILLVAAAAGAWYFFLFKNIRSPDLPREDIAQVESNFVREGNIVKDNPGLSPGIWYLLSESPGSPAQTTELTFDEDSVCAGKTASGQCNPSIFIKGRRAKVEGVTQGKAVRVQLLTFTQPLSLRRGLHGVEASP